MSSEFRTEAERYVIYCILDEIMNTVFVDKTYAKSPKAQYYSHLRGEHVLTRDAYANADLTEPKFYILEIVYCTGEVALKHILAWYHYFQEHGYSILADEKIGYMLAHMGDDIKAIYEEICAPYTPYEVLTRAVEELPAYPKKAISNRKKENKEGLKQFNIRVKESVIQAFRSFCEEREITQGEGLRLLVLSEDFEKRSALMETVQREFDEKDAEIARLQIKCKELMDLQRENETWVLHQRKEWIRIAETMIRYVMDRAISNQLTSAIEKRTLRFASKSDYQKFHSHQYPSSGDCYEVSVDCIVRGTERGTSGPDQDIPLFICGETADGALVKFRWYTKKKLIGVPPSDKTLARWGNSWLLGCILSKDGAADLVCAMPLQGLAHTDSLPQKDEKELSIRDTEKKAPSLDALIASAHKKHKQ